MAQAGSAGGQDAADRQALLPKDVLREEVKKPNVGQDAAAPSNRVPGPSSPDSITGPPGKKPNMANYRATNATAKRKEDDTNATGKMLGVTGMLRNPRIRLYVATGIGALPFLLTFMLYVSSFSFYGQFVIGILCGLCVVGVYYLFALHRTHVRKTLSVQVAQMSGLDADELKVLLPTEEAFPRWISFTDFEKMDWLNKSMTKMWPYIDQAAGALMKEKVQPILDNYAMGVIERIVLQTVAFGSRAPQILGVRLSQGGRDECVLEVEVLWETEKEGVVVAIDCPGPNYKVQVKKLHLQGTAKLVFRPLTATFPGFGAVLVSLTEPPEFDFDLKFLGGDIGALPGVEKMIDNSIRTALMDSMVWPSRIVVPMIPGDFSFLELHPVGELDVTLIEAKDVKNTDLLGKTDPFIVMFVRQTTDKIKRSKSKKNTLNPVWNENFKIEVEDPESQKLTLRLMDDESVEKSEYVGSAQLAITEFQPGVSKEMWCDILEDPNSRVPEKIRGRVHLVVTYREYTREQILAKRGGNETEKKIYQEQQILGATEKKQTHSASDAPKQAGNITQNPNERPRAPGPAAEL